MGRPLSLPPRALEAALLAALFALAAWLLFGELGAASFHDGDEALYASAARAMARGEGWLTPSYWGEPLFHKPPLLYWLMAASQELLPGSLELASRLPSALFSLALVGLVYATARRLAGIWAAALAALLLLSNHAWLFEHGARSANLDAALATLMFASLVAAAGRSRASLWASATCAAGVMLVKLPLVAFVALPIALHLARTDRARLAAWSRAALVTALLVALPWHAWMLLEHGRAFWDVYVGYEMLGRTGEAVSDADAGRAAHLVALARACLPWTPLALLATGWALSGRGLDARGREERRLLALYVVLLVAALFLVRSKWPWYVLPTYPALAVLTATFLVELTRRLPRLALALVAATLALRLLAMHASEAYAPAARAAHLWPADEPLYVAGPGGDTMLLWVGGALALSALALGIWRRASGGLAAATGALVALILGVGLLTVARVPRAFTAPVAALTAQLEREGYERVMTVGFWGPEVYGGRQMPTTSVYFLALDAEVRDGRDRFDLLDEPLPEHSALVVHRGVLTPKVRRFLTRKLATLEHPPDVWALTPTPEGGFEEVHLGSAP